jgi:hypothetical protein
MQQEGNFPPPPFAQTIRRDEMGRPAHTHDLPLFPSEEQIAELVVGRERVRDWPGIAATLEKRGFPKIDPLHGGRKLADVLAFYDRRPVHAQVGLQPERVPFTVTINAPDGREDFSEKSSHAPRRRPASRDRRAGT